MLSGTVAVTGLIAATLSFALAFRSASEVQDNLLLQTAALVSAGDLSVNDYAKPTAIPGVEFEDRIIIRRLRPAKTQLHPDFASTLSPGLHTVDTQDGSYRVLIRTLQTGTRVGIAQQTAVRDETAMRSALTAILTIALALIALLGVLTWILRRFFKPIEAMARALDARDEGDQSPIETAGLPSELWPFLAAFNRLITRVGKLMNAQRHFTAAAAHELRTPLASLSLQVERIVRDSQQSAIDRESVRELQSGLERNQRIVDQLLRLSRSQAVGRMVTETCCIDGVLREVVAESMPLINAKQIDLSVDSQQPLSVHIPREELGSVLTNIISNAVAYTSVGGCVVVRVGSSADDVSIAIEDNGPGLSDAAKARVTDAFYRCDGNRQQGSGLGLALVREIVEKCSGTVAIEDATAFASGLLVRIVLPRHEASLPNSGRRSD
ncbi:hypothetical protein HKX42_03795 [Salinisphaera sp. USBA-960]|nr:hypothetical protein [Salifodinibacter halophilus]